MWRNNDETKERHVMNLKIEVSLSSLLHYAAIVGFGFTLGIFGAVEVVWILWALVQAAKGLL